MTPGPGLHVFFFFFLAERHGVCFSVDSVSPVGVPLPSSVHLYLCMIMLLCKSLLPERSLVELIFGCYYITAPLSSLL